jgi:hypothetical protein
MVKLENRPARWETADKAMPGRTTWLGVERWEGMAK